VVELFLILDLRINEIRPCFKYFASSVPGSARAAYYTSTR